MAAYLQGQHRPAQELTASDIKTVLLDVMNQIGGTFEECPLLNLRQAYDLILPMIRHNHYEESSGVQNNRRTYDHQ